MEKFTNTALRDVNVRLADGCVAEMWAVLPVEHHERAIEEMARMGHHIELAASGETFDLPFTRVEFRPDHIEVTTHSDNGPLHETLPLGFSTHWAVERNGSMVTLVMVSKVGAA